MKRTKKIMKMEERLNESNLQLVVMKQRLQDKINKDTFNYGVPLGNKVLRDKIEKQEEKIMDLSMKINKENNSRFSLSNHDKKVLSAIRRNTDNINTESEKSNVDNRFRGSASSRRSARRTHFPIGEIKNG